MRYVSVSGTPHKHMNTAGSPAVTLDGWGIGAPIYFQNISVSHVRLSNAYLSSFDGLKTLFGHVLCIAHYFKFFNLLNTRRSVGLKYKPKNLRHKIIEFFTIIWIRVFTTLGTR